MSLLPLFLVAALCCASLQPSLGDYRLMNSTTGDWCLRMTVNFSVAVTYNTTSGQNKTVVVTGKDRTPELSKETSFCNHSAPCEKNMYEAGLVLHWENSDSSGHYSLTYFFFENVTKNMNWWMDGAQFNFSTHSNPDFADYADAKNPYEVNALYIHNPFKPVALNDSFSCNHTQSFAFDHSNDNYINSSSIINITLTVNNWKVQAFSFEDTTAEFGNRVSCKLDQGGTSTVPPIIVAVVVISFAVVLLVLFVITLVYDSWRTRTYKALN